MLSFYAQQELESEFNAQYDYMSEAYGATARDAAQMGEDDDRYDNELEFLATAHYVPAYNFIKNYYRDLVSHHWVNEDGTPYIYDAELEDAKFEADMMDAFIGNDSIPF